MPVKIPSFSEHEPSTEKHPLAIMQDAAEALGEQTGGEIEGSVFTLNPGGANLFRYTFYLVAPSLTGYTDPLFYAWHGVDPYPITLLPAGADQKKGSNAYGDPEGFENALTELFASSYAFQHINALMNAVDAASKP